MTDEFKTTLIKVAPFVSEKTVDIGDDKMAGEVPTKPDPDWKPTPVGANEEPLEEEAPLIPDLVPFSTQDLEYLFVRKDPKDPNSPFVDGCGWCVTDHDEKGNPILWTRTASDIADKVEADSRCVVEAKLDGWPVEEAKPEDVIDIKPIDEKPIDPVGDVEPIESEVIPK